MKKFLKYSFAALVAMSAAVFTSCTPEDVASVNAGAIPSASDYENAIEIITDQETNNVTFNLNAAGVYPVWIFDGKTYSTVNGLEKIFTVAGDYQVEVKIANANGVSDGTIVKTFTLNETKFDFTKYYKYIAGDTEKQWYVASTEQGHLGCGEPGTDGQGWWSAAPGDKAAWGVYDDVMTFTADGGYTYNPGEGGTVYVNTGCTIFAEHNTNDGQDFMVPVEEQTTTYTLDVEGADLYVVLPPQTLAPYIPNDAFYNNGARYRVESMNAKKMVLIADLEGISWRLILTSELPKDENESTETWADFASEQNLWYGANIVDTTMWWADPNWGTQPSPATETLENGIKLTVDAGYTGTQQWQGQLAFETDLALSASKTYDVAVTITTDNDIPGVTTKLCYVGVDANADGDKDDAADGDINGDNDPYIVFVSQTDCAGGESTIIKHFNVTAAADIPAVKFVFDFGGAPAGSIIEITDIIIQEHVEGNGEIPAQPEEPSMTWVDYASADNLWYNSTFAQATFWWADNGWAQIADPAFELLDNGFSLVATEGVGAGQWQAQVALETTDLNMDEGVLYDVQVTITPSCDIPGVTTKICHIDNDLNGDGNIAGEEDGDSYFLMEGRTDCPADESTVISFVGVAAPANPTGTPMKFCFDFGGVQGGATVEVTNIIIQKHVE